jgi:hypothetical protein
MSQAETAEDCARDCLKLADGACRCGSQSFFAPPLRHLYVTPLQTSEHESTMLVAAPFLQSPLAASTSVTLAHFLTFGSISVTLAHAGGALAVVRVNIGRNDATLFVQHPPTFSLNARALKWYHRGNALLEGPNTIVAPRVTDSRA